MRKADIKIGATVGFTNKYGQFVTGEYRGVRMVPVINGEEERASVFGALMGGTYKMCGSVTFGALTLIEQGK